MLLCWMGYDNVLSAQLGGCGVAQNPLQAIMAHPDYGTLYFDDPACATLGLDPLNRMLDIVCENTSLAGLHAAEIGAGTGGLTRQARSYSLRPAFGRFVLLLEPGPAQWFCMKGMLTGSSPDSSQAQRGVHA